jgi:Rod binding domain-containing protein
MNSKAEQKPKMQRPQIKRDDLANVPDEYKKIAEGMESQFAKLMIDQMRKSIQKSDKESSAENFYRSVMDSKYADLMTKGEGLGLQKVILDQIYPRHKRINQYKKVDEQQMKIHQNPMNQVVGQKKPGDES